jgi:hypothetical protein
VKRLPPSRVKSRAQVTQPDPPTQTPPANVVSTGIREAISSGVGLLLWGAIVLYCPTYFGTPSWLTTTLYVVALLLFVISVRVAFNELSKAFRNQALSDLGNVIGFTFLVAVVWSLTRFKPFPEPWQAIAQWIAVVAALVDSIFIASVLAALPERIATARAPDSTRAPDRARALNRATSGRDPVLRQRDHRLGYAHRPRGVREVGPAKSMQRGAPRGNNTGEASATSKPWWRVGAGPWVRESRPVPALARRPSARRRLP